MRHTNCVHRRIGFVNDCLVPVISELMRIKIALVERERHIFLVSDYWYMGRYVEFIDPALFCGAHLPCRQQKKRVARAGISTAGQSLV